METDATPWQKKVMALLKAYDPKALFPVITKS
jgi:hypothetical protein